MEKIDNITAPTTSAAADPLETHHDRVQRHIDEVKTEIRKADEPRFPYPLTIGVDKDLENRFRYHAPKSDQAERYETLRFQARELAKTIVKSTPPSREQSLALTKLEEAIFFANAAIARHE